MTDKAREKADKELLKMERYLAGLYKQAGKDLEDKFKQYTKDFERLEEQHKGDVESGNWTQEQFDEWRKNKLLYGEHWTRLIQYAQKEMANANKTAIAYVNDKATQVYADSYNSLREVIENSDVKGYSFELVDANTVKNLVKEEGIILPPKKNLDVQKDKLWNAKQVNAQLLQGILQGESIPKIAARMQNVANADLAGATRTARTMITAAENSGRQSGMNKAEEDGIIFWKMWIATSDERTRESHNVLNGQVVPNGEMFVTINGEELEFPGDWRADGSEVYNCRCSLGTIVKGFARKQDNNEDAIESREDFNIDVPIYETSVNNDENKSSTVTNREEAMEMLVDGENSLFQIDENSDYSKINEKFLVKSTNFLFNLEGKYDIIKKRKELEGGTKSKFIESDRSIMSMNSASGDLKFNPEVVGKSEEYITELIKINVEGGKFMSCLEENYIKYPIAHEYGHAIEGYYVSKLTETKYSLSDEKIQNALIEVRKEIIAIAEKNNPDFKFEDNVSEYGTRNEREFFAECFANSVLGKPNELGKATTQWLKEKGLIT